MSMWGDVPTWVGAIGTLGAVFWAVYLYRRSLIDSEREQARLLAPVGGAVPVQVLPGDEVESESWGTPDLLGVTSNMRPVVIAEAYMATVRLVSTSEEAFSDVAVALLMEDGREEDFPLAFREIAPHEEKKATCYYRPGTISGSMRVRLRFRDANGRQWERVNGEPVRPYSNVIKKTWRKRAIVVAIVVMAALGLLAFFTPAETRPWLVAACAMVALGLIAFKAVATIFEDEPPSAAFTKVKTRLALSDLFAFVFALSAIALAAFTCATSLNS